jgi:hypothetical protein
MPFVIGEKINTMKRENERNFHYDSNRNALTIQQTFQMVF